MTTNLLSVIEQQQKALEHCVDAIVERGLNGSQEQARKWGLQLPLERAYAALAACQQALEQTRGEPERSLYEMLQMGLDENKQLRAQLAGMERLLHFKAAIEADPPASEPAPLSHLKTETGAPPEQGAITSVNGSEPAPKRCGLCGDCDAKAQKACTVPACFARDDYKPAPSTDICRNCAGQGWEPSVNNGKVPCSFCHPAPSTAGEPDLAAYVAGLEHRTHEMKKKIEALDYELRIARQELTSAATYTPPKIIGPDAPHPCFN